MEKIKTVIPLDNFRLQVLMSNNSVLELDMKPLISEFKPYQEFFKNDEVFNEVKVALGGYGLVWSNRITLDVEEIIARANRIDESTTFYAMSKAIIDYITAYRKERNMSQNELSTISGVNQPNIARIEAGKTDPQLSTLLKLTNALGLKISLQKGEDLLEFGMIANSVDGGLPTEKGKKIMRLYANGDIDLETAKFALRRTHEQV